MADDRTPERIDGLLSDFLERTGVADELERVSALDDWDDRVGERIASVTHPRSVHGATLVVEVRSSAWLMELNMMKGRILDRLNDGRNVPLDKLVFVLSPQG